MKKEVILIIIFLISIFAFITPTKEWDEYVYLLNAKHFNGESIYFENIRPPILPLIISVFQTIKLEFLTPYILFTLLIVILYLFSKDKNSVLIFLTFPIVLIYSQKFMTSLPATLLALVSILLLKQYVKNKENKYLYASFFLAGLTTLTRYPMGLTYLIILILYFFFAKKKEYKHLIIAQLFFIIPILLWVIFAGLESFYYAFHWANRDANPMHYLINAPIIIGPCLLLLPFLFNYKYKKKHLWFLVPLIVYLTFFQIFSNKENRYFIPALPFFALLLSKTVKMKKELFTLVIVLFFLISLYTSYYYFSTFCDNTNSLNKLSDYFKNHSKVIILSNFWPICSYYTNNTCYALIEPYHELTERINYVNASYIVVSDMYSYPSYSTNSSNFNNYTINKLINEGCETIYVYGIN